MPKTTGQKLKLLYLRDYLLKNTDENHSATVKDMMDYLAGLGISAERKAIYEDMEALREYGMDIETVRVSKANGYHVVSDDFQLPEIKLLVDAVQSSRFISEKKSLDLIKRIENLTSRHNARELQRHVVVQNRGKSVNEAIFYNVDSISEAISKNVMVEFKYFDYDIQKKPVYRHEGKFYRVSACFLVWDDENYYLVAVPEGEETPRHYRVDKMKYIRLTRVPAVRGDVDPAKYANSLFGMFHGEERDVRIKFANRMSSVAVDRFGLEPAFVPCDEEHFTLTARVAVSDLFFSWIAGLGDGAEIVGPEDVRDRMREFLRKSIDIYE